MIIQIGLACLLIFSLSVLNHQINLRILSPSLWKYNILNWSIKCVQYSWQFQEPTFYKHSWFDEQQSWMEGDPS